MGQVQTEQVVRIIEAVKQPEVVEIVKEADPNYWWIPITAALITAIATIVVALIRRK